MFFNLFDSIFFILFPLVFLFTFGIIVFSIVSGLKTYNKNNNSPRLTVEARIVSKRTSVSHHTHANAGDISGAHGYHTTSSTSYFITFEVESTDRMEFHVNSYEYGMLAEGDFGKLTFQGTRYISFTRI